MNTGGAQPLRGCRIVTTRPDAQAAGLAAELGGLGATVENFPVIAILSADPAPLRQVDLAAYDLAFFVSPNAVEHALAIRPRGDWPASLRVATVGPASARLLRACGWGEVIVPEVGFDSEAVLALADFAPAAVAGRRVLLLRGEGGRELLAEVLRERGARVDACCVYRRAAAALDPAALVARFGRGELTALVFSASEGLHFFLAICGEAGLAMLRALPCFAPHSRILAALLAAGAADARLTPPGDAGIAAGIAAALAVVPSGENRSQD